MNNINTARNSKNTSFVTLIILFMTYLLPLITTDTSECFIVHQKLCIDNLAYSVLNLLKNKVDKHYFFYTFL